MKRLLTYLTTWDGEVERLNGWMFWALLALCLFANGLLLRSIFTTP